MRTRLAIFLLGAGLAAGASSASASAAVPLSGHQVTNATLTVRGSNWGRILFDTRGRALYAFTRDPRGRSACSGACAAAWPPYLLRGRIRAGEGVRPSLLGTTRRRDGRRQVTYAGRPLYYYVGDRRPGEVRCQNVFGFGGLWLVMRPNGRVVR
jgi:predicted lipoprotein with Yx(FWY)xxD motif